MGLQSNESSGYSSKKDRYQPPEAGLLGKIHGYHLLYNEEDPGTNHLIADVDLGGSTPNQVEAVFPASEDEYDDDFFSAFEDVLSRISTFFGPLLQTNNEIEGFTLNVKGIPIQLRLMCHVCKD